MDGIHSSQTNSTQFIQLKAFKNYLFLLDENHTFSIWDAHTFVQLNHLTQFHILDFTLLHSENGLNIVSMVQSNDLELRMFDLESNQFIFKEKLDMKPCKFMDAYGLDDRLDSAFVLQVLKDSKDTKLESKMTLKLKKLYKTLPLHQFQYFIEQHRFDEAQELALQFGMDSQVTLKFDLIQIFNVKVCHENKASEFIK